MCAALRSILTVYEGIIVFAVCIGVGESDFHIGAFGMDNRVKQFIAVGLVFEQIEQTAFGNELLPVVADTQASVEIGVIPDLLFQVFGYEPVIPEYGFIRLKADERSIRFFGIGFRMVVYQFAAAEFGNLCTAFAHTFHCEAVAECIHRLRSDPVQSNRFLKGFAVVLTAGIDFTHTIDHFAQGNTATEIANGYFMVFDADINFLSMAHHVFVDAVIDDFFYQYVDTIIGAGAVAKFTDVHTRAESDMFLPVKTPDFVFGIFYGIGHETKLNKGRSGQPTEFCTGVNEKAPPRGQGFSVNFYSF